MIKCKVIEDFSLKNFDKLKNIERVSVDRKGNLYVGDVFECDEDMAIYLTGNNPLKKVVVEVIEVEPETHEAEVVEATKIEVNETNNSKTNVYKNDEMCYNKPIKKGRKKKEV